MKDVQKNMHSYITTYNFLIIKAKDDCISERNVLMCLSTVNMTPMWDRNRQHPKYCVNLVPIKLVPYLIFLP